MPDHFNVVVVNATKMFLGKINPTPLLRHQANVDSTGF